MVFYFALIVMDPNKTTKSTEIKQKKPRSSKNDASEESELKKEMHRKCESVITINLNCNV